MAIQYRIDVIAALKAAGFSTYKIRKEKILGESVLQQLRNNEPVSWANINTICRLLGCNVGDLVEYVENPEDN